VKVVMALVASAKFPAPAVVLQIPGPLPIAVILTGPVPQVM